MSNQAEESIRAFPEQNGNFIGNPTDYDGCSRFLADTGYGNFHVHLALNSRRDADPDDVWVFMGHRMLTAGIPRFKGSCEVSGNVHVGLFPSSDPDRRIAEKLAVSLIAPSLFLTDLRISEIDCPTIHITGDFSACAYPASFAYHPLETAAGWGQMLPCFLTGKAAVADHARPGLTLKSYRKEGTHAQLLRELKEKDYVLIQFDPGNTVSENPAGVDSFCDELAERIREIQDCGSRPVLVTPLAGNTWWGGGYQDLKQAHADAIKRLGDKMDIPVLDLHDKTASAIRNLERKETSVLYLSGDSQKTNDCGAYFAARIIASEIRRTCGWTEGYQTLAEAIDKHALMDSDPARQVFAYYRSRA